MQSASNVARRLVIAHTRTTQSGRIVIQCDKSSIACTQEPARILLSRTLYHKVQSYTGVIETDGLSYLQNGIVVDTHCAGILYGHRLLPSLISL